MQHDADLVLLAARRALHAVCLQTDPTRSYQVERTLPATRNIGTQRFFETHMISNLKPEEAKHGILNSSIKVQAPFVTNSGPALLRSSHTTEWRGPPKVQQQYTSGLNR